MTNKATVYLASLDTRHFSFRAIGSTEAKALKALQRGWKRHMVQHKGNTPFAEFADDVEMSAIKLGECYRDREQIV